MKSHPSPAEARKENVLVSENEVVINLVKFSTPAQKKSTQRGFKETSCQWASPALQHGAYVATSAYQCIYVATCLIH